MPASQQTSKIPSARVPAPVATTVIAPLHGLSALRLRELWDFRELGGFLIWRDLKVRFRQTMFGVLWAVIQPLLLTAVFTIFLNRVAGVYSYDLPYAVFALSGVIPWTLFSRALMTSSGSLVDNQHLIGKVERSGYTLVPLDLHYKSGRIKIDIGLARGKKQHDKRETEKKRDWDREKQRLMRSKSKT